MGRSKITALAGTILTSGLLALPLGAHAQAAATTPTAPSSEAGGSALQEIVVTARRRAENVQNTPVSITAVTGDAVRRAGITNVQQLMTFVPGVNFTGSASPVNTVFSIRGMSRGVIGDAPPAVATYIDDVPTSTWDAGLPTYDVSNVQVLKGPQGTLFGKNTTAGAILVNTREPTYQYGGWVQVTAGSYAWHDFQGAINLPLVEDKLALRVAADIDRRNGYTKNMSVPGADFDDIHDNNFRISLRADPTNYLKNVTVFDSTESITHGAGSVLYSYTPGGVVDEFPWTNGTLSSVTPLVPCNGAPVCDASAAVARQIAAGPREAWDDLPPSQKVRTQSVINTTTLDAGPVTVKNIFGWRKVYTSLYSNIDGYEAPLVNASTLVNVRQFSDELQASGKTLDNSLTYIGGLFWIKSEPSGPNLLAIQEFAFPGTPITSTGINPLLGFPLGGYGNGDFYTDESKAIYGQVNFAFSELSPLLKGLSTDIGLRYTWDTARVCSIIGEFTGNPAGPPSACQASDSAGTESSKLTYTLGLNYQVTKDILAYAVSRRGYRAGGVNPPKLGGTLAPFQSYAPELVQDLELGLKTTWNLSGVRGRFNFAAYDSHYKHLQASVTTGASTDPDADGNPFDNPSNQSIFVNLGSARVRGLEGEFAVSPMRGLELTASGTVIDKSITSVSAQLPSSLDVTFTAADLASFAFLGAPKYSYDFGATYTSHVLGERGDLVFAGTYFKISSIQYGSVMAPSYDRVDLRIDWNHALGSAVDASLFVTNATNKASIRGPSFSSPGFGVNAVNYNEPRIAGVRLRYAFGGER